jgi:hypothetical protein
MIQGDPDSTFAQLSQQVAASGANVHAMVWKAVRFTPQYAANSDAVDGINELKQGALEPSRN